MNRIILVLFSLLTAFPAFGAWSRVQLKSNAPGTSAASRAVTITSSVSGDILVVAIVSGDTNAARAVTGVTDNRGDTYAKLVSVAGSGGLKSDTELWYCLNPLSGVITVTATISASANQFLDAFVAEYNPGGTASRETATNGSASSTSVTTIQPGSITTTGSDDLVVVFAGMGTATGCSAPFTFVDGTDGNGYCDAMNQSAGSFNPTVTSSSSAISAAVIGAFSTASAASTAKGRIWIQ